MENEQQNSITVTCLFGNGFDLALGLETSFTHFVQNRYLHKYAYYQPADDGKSVCNRLADKIAYDTIVEGVKTWADAEMSFAKLNSDVLGPKEEDRAANFEKVYTDFSRDLKEYLGDQDWIVDQIPDRRWQEKGRELLENVVGRVDELFHLDLRLISSVTVNFITLNYTRTLEKMVQPKMAHRVRRPSGGRTIDVRVGEVISAHGTLADSIIFGIDDLNDVAEPTVRAQCEDYFIKDREAWADKTGRRVRGYDLLGNSDYALLFGVACGRSDAEWWRKLYSEAFDVGGGLRIIFCDYDKNEQETCRLLSGEEGKKSCLKVFDEDVVPSSEVEARLATYWQRMGAFVGRDVLGLGEMREEIQNAIKETSAQDPSAQRPQPVDCKAYLKAKEIAGDTFAATLRRGITEQDEAPRFDAPTPTTEDFLGAIEDKEDEKKKVYVWVLSQSLSKGKGAGFKLAILEWLEDHAEGLAKDALFAMGWLRQWGEEKNLVQAVKWYTEAADQGHVKAQLNLGLMHYFGHGVAMDKGETVYWYTQAAEQGDAPAQFALGVMYANGEGVAKDQQKAVKWYTKAAEQGDAMAQCNLGNMYYKGEGVAMDRKKAVYWYTQAAEQGDEDAKMALEEISRSQNGADGE